MLKIAMYCTYNDAARTPVYTYTQPKYRNLSTNNSLDIEFEYFCDNIIYHYPTSVYIFCKYNARSSSARRIFEKGGGGQEIQIQKF